MYRSSLCWIRRDLRLNDHRALFEATTQSQQTTVVFVYDTTILDQLSERHDRRVSFIKESLDEVDAGLREHGSGLLTLVGNPVELIPRLAALLGVDAVFCSHDDDPYACSRDAVVKKKLGSVAFHSFKDHVIFEKQEVVNQQGLPFRVYTPYMKAWKANFLPGMASSFEPDFAKLTPVDLLPEEHLGNRSFEEIGFHQTQNWVGSGEKAARKQLERFMSHVHRYAETRDFPALSDGVSGLSVHLRHGTISVRECVRAALSGSSNGHEKWFNELIWREFYHMILACFPHVVESPFQTQYEGLKWPVSREAFEVWAAGQTGYPIVDAAMRCLNETGWMHNRLRMIVASFLTKDLLCDYRWGEAYFAEKLLDFELSSNNGGWQWAASVGVDAQPYFRIFNPVLQSKKFDAEGKFIREWCPELAGFDNTQIHEPWAVSLMDQLSAGCEIGRNYPAPVVEHHVQKDLAIRLLTPQT